MSGTAARGLLEHINETWGELVVAESMEGSRGPLHSKARESPHDRQHAAHLPHVLRGEGDGDYGASPTAEAPRKSRSDARDDVRLQTTSLHPRREDLTPRAGRRAGNEARACGILALDLKGAFYNVSHVSVLQNLNMTSYGRKTFGYIKDFLS